MLAIGTDIAYIGVNNGRTVGECSDSSGGFRGFRFRRADRRGGHFGDRHGRPPAREVPGQELRDPRTARRSGRDLGPVPLSGNPLGFGHAHAGLRVRAVEAREIDRRCPRDPRLPQQDRR